MNKPTIQPINLGQTIGSGKAAGINEPNSYSAEYEMIKKSKTDNVETIDAKILAKWIKKDGKVKIEENITILPSSLSSNYLFFVLGGKYYSCMKSIFGEGYNCEEVSEANLLDNSKLYSFLKMFIPSFIKNNQQANYIGKRTIDKFTADCFEFITSNPTYGEVGAKGCFDANTGIVVYVESRTKTLLPEGIGKTFLEETFTVTAKNIDLTSPSDSEFVLPSQQ